MKPVRITAAARHVHEDLIRQYEKPILHACDVELNDQWISENACCPDGFCPSAWSNLQPFVFALANGAQDLFDGWMKNPASAMISCNDGFRPLSFYLEALDEQEKESADC